MTEDAVQAEAEGVDTVAVEYKGETYTFPSSIEKAHGKVLRAFEDGKSSYLLEYLMRPNDWVRFEDVALVEDYAGLVTAYLKTIGMDPGN